MTAELATLAGIAWLVLRVEVLFRRIRRQEAFADILVKGHAGDPAAHRLLPQQLEAHAKHVF